jgi:hypothetical protein
MIDHDIVETRVHRHDSVPGHAHAAIVHAHEDASIRVAQILWYALGVIESLLAIRFVLKMLGANPVSAFVSLIYGVTDALLAPFAGIFRPAIARGAEVASVIEPATLVALAVYALVFWGIARVFENRAERHALAV